MLRLASVGSGSKGNATLVATDETTILIDCGFPVREMLVRLPQLGVDISDIDAILVTHEHSDHIGGVAAVAKAAGAQVFATWHRGVRKTRRRTFARAHRQRFQLHDW